MIVTIDNLNVKKNWRKIISESMHYAKPLVPHTNLLQLLLKPSGSHKIIMGRSFGTIYIQY
jgi:hypothetical protein